MALFSNGLSAPKRLYSVKVTPPPVLRPSRPPKPRGPSKGVLAGIGLTEIIVGLVFEAATNPVTPAIDAAGLILVGIGSAVGAALLFEKSRIGSLVLINLVSFGSLVVMVLQHMSLLGPFLIMGIYNLTRALLILQKEIAANE